ncbi:hypothetical protein PCC7424_5540 (plasmid) [Gloeothece citriformis PCC 7424]|uniref:Uncharacterized protein n=1 Tax=Gloeothece citriformis (strain PCC 7424) TaxID=65393 RepID=B7KMT5_GLOC7|nr:hypothetical protein [Gloeothece citriformis]ACK74107.1 hypothetical protein PCC7424_5540 [Gloeothece citriformis PCC 7424]
MAQFPIILIPPEIREAQPQLLSPPIKPQPPIKPTAPESPPPEPQPVNVQKALVIVLTGFIISLIALTWSAVVGGVAFLVSLAAIAQPDAMCKSS